MKNKKFIFILIFVFIVVTVLGFCTDTNVQKVHFRNQNFNISQENASFTNKDVDISLSNSGIKNKDINSKVSNIKINNNNANYKNQDVNISSNGKISNTKSKIEDINKLFDELNENVHYKNDKYSYQSVSWNEWKSNFINRFLDDSVYLTCLDNYGLGTWFHYSFEVTKYGNIENIKIFSFYLKPEDKAQIKKLIQSYAYKSITKFPPNSKRLRAKVEAIVLLGDTETKTKPSDFNDTERIKVKY